LTRSRRGIGEGNATVPAREEATEVVTVVTALR
jgi:hypothetical protein